MANPGIAWRMCLDRLTAGPTNRMKGMRTMKWNILAIRTGNDVRLTLPDDQGNLPPVPKGVKGWFISWPLNPHFTGLTVIRLLLQDTEPMQGLTIL